MLKRRVLLRALIGLTLVLTLWHMSLLETDNNGAGGIARRNQMLLVDPADPLPKDDYSSLIDLKDFKFTINVNSCTEDRRSPLVLVVVHTAPTHWPMRNTIRDTWGQHDPRAKLVFLLGAVNSSELQSRIEQESRQFDDIVQGSFLDAYRNMTYKHVMALKWFTYHCPEAKYILKVDDDAFINTPALYHVMSGWHTQRRRLLYCLRHPHREVSRAKDFKWFVSFQEYSERFFPNFCTGYFILYSPDVAYQLYREAMRQPYFWVDDVHITGIIAQRINITITPAAGTLLYEGDMHAIIEDRIEAIDQAFFFTRHALSEDQIRKLWKVFGNVVMHWTMLGPFPFNPRFARRPN